MNGARIAIGLQASNELQLEAGNEAIVDIQAGSDLTLVMTLSDRAPMVFVPPEETQAWGWAAVNVVASLIVGLAAVWLGFLAGRQG